MNMLFINFIILLTITRLEAKLVYFDSGSEITQNLVSFRVLPNYQKVAFQLYFVQCRVNLIRHDCMIFLRHRPVHLAAPVILELDDWHLGFTRPI